MRSALIVIDMQEGSFTPRTARHDSAGLVSRLNALAGRLRAAGDLVIFIQHHGPADDPHHPSKPGWQILPELDREASDPVVAKTACDAFLDSHLDQILEMAGVKKLIITGCATDFCVDTTVRSALARRYDTVVPSDGHTTADRPHLSAPQIIAHHNAIWSEFIAPAGPAKVRPCAEI